MNARGFGSEPGGFMVRPLATRLSLVLALALLATACGSGGDDTNGLGKGTQSSKGSGATGGTGSGIVLSGGTTGNGGPGAGGGGNATASGGTGPYMLPAGYTKADDGGGWLLGDAVVEGQMPPTVGTQGSSSCGQQILGIVRDFRRGDDEKKYPNGHPDFETFTGIGQKGIVENTLGSDDKPVYNNSEPRTFPKSQNQGCDDPSGADDRIACTTTQANYDQWYRDTANVNDPYYIFFSLEPNGKNATFHSSAFFPLDNQGFGNQGFDHNFSFTTEVHTTFLYSGGETFSFTGDDDVWVFINKKLAVDLGGLHSEQSASVSLDQDAKTLGIKTGNVYPLDLFHAERHTTQSNFKIDTNLYFVDCGVIVPSGPVK
jgi:fibro-slime domain-containing protein